MWANHLALVKLSFLTNDMGKKCLFCKKIVKINGYI